jgi:pyruvyl transferase EpsO
VSAGGGCPYGCGEPMTAETFRAALLPWIPPGAPVAITDVPVHRNVGDLFILAAAHHLFRTLGCRIVYAAGVRDYSPRAARRVVTAETVIVGLGGGNFGDLYPRYQRLRERVAADFPHHRMVILPQTLHVRDRAAFRQKAASLANHRDVRIAVRDRASLDLAGDLTPHVQLLPDIVDALGADAIAEVPPLERPGPDIRRLLDSHGTFHLLRQDAERAGPSRGRSNEWTDVLPGFTLRLAMAAGLMTTGPAVVRAGVHGRWATAAAVTLADVVRRLRHCERVVTDRLHGAIAARLAGRPVTLIDNSYGKLRGYYDTWWCDDPSMTFDAGTGS